MLKGIISSMMKNILKRSTNKTITPVSRFERIPPAVEGYFADRLGVDARAFLTGMDRYLLESNEKVPDTPVNPKSWGDWSIGIPFSGKDYRPIGAFSHKKIKWMRGIGICQFILNMKLAPALSPFRDETGWEVQCLDRELKDISSASLRPILPMFSIEFGETSMWSGFALFEQAWGNKSKYELGLSSSRSAQTLFSVPGLPRSIDPERIKHINRRKKDGAFDGFTIEQSNHPGGLRLHRQQALLMTYQQRYRSLYGNPFPEPMFNLATFYEISMRSMLRFIDRMATPVAVGEGPSSVKVEVPTKNGTVKMMGIAAAYRAAARAGYSSAIAIPSDVDPATNQPQFRVYYLETKGDLSPFIRGIELIQQDMLRAGMAADRALSQTSGGVGSYNIGEIHMLNTLTHTDRILTEWVYQINKYFMPYFSLYNRGVGGPPIYLLLQFLDPRRAEVFGSLLQHGGESPAYRDMLMGIDWPAMAKINNIPFLSDAEKERLRQKLLDEALERQEALTPAPSPSRNGQEQIEKVKKAARGVAGIAMADHLPIIISEGEWNRFTQALGMEE